MVRKPRRTETVSTVRVDKQVWTGPALSRLIVYALDVTHLVLAVEHGMVKALEKGRTLALGLSDLDKQVWTGPALSRLIVYALDVTHLVLAVEHGMVKALEKGRTLALGLSDLAVAWGDSTAYSWRFDGNFQRHLGSGVLFG